MAICVYLLIMHLGPNLSAVMTVLEWWSVLRCLVTDRNWWIICLACVTDVFAMTVVVSMARCYERAGLWGGGGEGGAHRINKGHEPYSLQAHFLSTVPRAHPVLSKVTDMDAHPCVLR